MPRIDFVIGFMCFSLALGKASALLPIYHYAFTTYSCAIAELIAGTDTELYTKTDLRFMEGCYKVYKHMLQLEQNSNLLFKCFSSKYHVLGTLILQILRDLFHYKPPITKEQFFNSGFVERKIIMCTEVMKLIQKKNKSLQPPRKAPTTTTSNLAQMISTKVIIFSPGSGNIYFNRHLFQVISTKVSLSRLLIALGDTMYLLR